MKNKYLENLKKGKELNELRLTKIKKRIEVKLSKVDDIEEAINRGLGLYEFVEEAIDKATTEFVKAKDIVRFDMNDAYIEAEGELEELLDGIDALGIDVPSEVQTLKSRLKDLEDEIDAAQSLIDNF
jgi:chaperonin cofactor prefoldin